MKGTKPFIKKAFFGCSGVLIVIAQCNQDKSMLKEKLFGKKAEYNCVAITQDLPVEVKHMEIH